MHLHMPVVLALAAVVLFLSRKASLRAHHAVTCGAFGFYLAGTGLSTSIHAAGANLLSMLGQFGA